MKILFVASRFPCPPVQGDRVRGYHHLRILSRKHDVVLVAPEPEGDRAANLKIIQSVCAQIETVSTPFWRRLRRLGQIPFTSLPLQTLYFFDPRFRQEVQSLLQQQSFDLIHVQLVRMAPVVDGLGDIPRVIDLIDALSLNMDRRAQRERGPKAWVVALEARRLQRYERMLTRQYNQLVVSSPLDRDAVGNYSNVHVISNGVDTEAYPFVQDGRESGTIVFTGRMGYFPNADAAIWFATAVLPLVRQRVPQARFLIVGASPTRAVRQLGRLQGVVVTGYVPSIQEYLAQATVAVAPMCAGSGMQFKVLEAMSSGAPVVATPYALGGIEAQDDEHLLVAQDAETFAEQVICMLGDQTLRRRLASNARQLVEEKYTWERSVAMLEGLYWQAREDVIHNQHNIT
jgi:sugar transferase (PEP-CTERM/EpsH1 system associated)